ncbi:MAG: hypothetical protein WC657_03560 [Candidatus Paceibacterota bacterium]|jgi:uncharacterized protein (UPF0335 family)|uniref:hypothetical protein n=1 Tax=Methylomonas montana TaxID=3058963 RepID=UPI002657F70C|nr:hypothetical protein [Methylomonas montana]WKJ90220.1 hypothetical protein QZJ86_19745 [Methylomonas montana]
MMFINTASNIYSTRAPTASTSTYPSNSANNITTGNAASGGDSVQISSSAYKALNDSKATTSDGVKLIFDRVNSDPEFAKEMANVYTYSRDFELVDLNDLPSLSDASAMSAYTQQVKSFENEADKIRDQRIQIYTEMKGSGASDSDIFNKIMQFNKNLPEDYQAKTGLDKYSKYLKSA